VRFGTTKNTKTVVSSGRERAFAAFVRFVFQINPFQVVEKVFQQRTPSVVAGSQAV
jgi:hypothetical protein